jgi:hypothetical protein
LPFRFGLTTGAERQIQFCRLDIVMTVDGHLRRLWTFRRFVQLVPQELNALIYSNQTELYGLFFENEIILNPL